MLNISKSVILNGTISIDNDVVVHMNATINTNGGNGANVSKTIMNQDLYDKNRESVRLEIDTFESEVYKIEDSMMDVVEPVMETLSRKVVK